jgi:hypothetical protein
MKRITNPASNPSHDRAERPPPTIYRGFYGSERHGIDSITTRSCCNNVYGGSNWPIQSRIGSPYLSIPQTVAGSRNRLALSTYSGHNLFSLLRVLNYRRSFPAKQNEFMGLLSVLLLPFHTQAPYYSLSPGE